VAGRPHAANTSQNTSGLTATHQPHLVRVLDPKYELPSVFSRKQRVEQCSAQPTKVQKPRGGRRKPHANHSSRRLQACTDRAGIIVARLSLVVSLLTLGCTANSPGVRTFAQARRATSLHNHTCYCSSYLRCQEMQGQRKTPPGDRGTRHTRCAFFLAGIAQ